MSIAKVGVLSLQGDFARHSSSVEALGLEAVPVKRPKDLEGLGALLLPGGESTTLLTLIEAGGLRAPLAAFVSERPTLGTCAGLILLGQGGERLPAPPFGVLDATVVRNAYGRQIDSFSAEVEAPVVGERFHAVFIRAPRVGRVGPNAEVIARRLRDSDAPDEPVGVRSGKAVGLCFHPELTSDLRFHRWFLVEVAGLSLPAPDLGPSPPASPTVALASRGAGS